MDRYSLINEVRNDGIEALLENSSLSEVIDLFINCYIDCGFELERSYIEAHFEDYDEAKAIISKRLMWEELKK